MLWDVYGGNLLCFGSPAAALPFPRACSSVQAPQQHPWPLSRQLSCCLLSILSSIPRQSWSLSPFFHSPILAPMYSSSHCPQCSKVRTALLRQQHVASLCCLCKGAVACSTAAPSLARLNTGHQPAHASRPIPRDEPRGACPFPPCLLSRAHLPSHICVPSLLI